MRVLYDYQILSFQKYGGISRYFYELFTAFKEKYRDNIVVKMSAVYSRNYYFTPYIEQHDEPIGKLGEILNKYRTIIDICVHYLIGKPYDIIHPTYFFPNYLERIPKFIRKKSKLIITVYDMIYEIFYPETDDIPLRANIIHESDGIITISEQTKRDLLRIYPDIPESKVRVIYLGNSMKKPHNKMLTCLPKNYILMVGQRSLYKDGVTVFKAFGKMKDCFDDLQLLCAGGNSFSIDEQRIIKELGMENSIIQMSLTDEELYYAYKNAKCFIFPSIYEGFGLPILESFYCGCPTILSNASCFPEIAQDAALYYEPEDSDELAEKICLVIGDAKISGDLTRKGYERLNVFDWNCTIERTFEFYREVINGN